MEAPRVITGTVGLSTQSCSSRGALPRVFSDASLGPDCVDNSRWSKPREAISMPWFSTLPCSTCRSEIGPEGVYVASGVHFCAPCLPFVLAAIGAMR